MFKKPLKIRGKKQMQKLKTVERKYQNKLLFVENRLWRFKIKDRS